MEYEAFIERVQALAGLDEDEARRATEATLSTLGERLERRWRDRLASQLPQGMKPFLYEWQKGERSREDNPRFSLEEFYNKVAARADVRYGQAVQRANAVMKVLRQAVSTGELADVLSELPEDYAKLFGELPTP
jgi:uncharacterized protein (DUF2267 family)